MFAVFFLLWILLNGRLTGEVLVLGLIICGSLYAFCCSFLGYHPRKDLFVIRHIPFMIRYIGLLLSEIIKSNLHLARIVLHKSVEINPQLLTFHVPLTGSISKGILADSITLTPGTITVLVEGSQLSVHCLDASFAEGIENSIFQRQLLTLQEGDHSHDAS